MTTILQGTYTADGTARIIPLRSDVDWMETLNVTTTIATVTTATVKAFWMRAFPDNSAIVTAKSGAAARITSEGFILVDTSKQILGPPISILTITGDDPSRVTNSGDNGLSAGDVVRFTSLTGARQLDGIDFTVSSSGLTSTAFRLAYGRVIVAGTTGTARRVIFDPIYYPRRRIITNITQASSAVVRLSVDNGYTVGQEVRIYITAPYGMIEANNRTGTITSINTTTNEITLNINSNNFTAFKYPVTAQATATPPQIVPIGESTVFSTSISSATTNRSLIGMRLGTGAVSAGGVSGDVIFWRAGKSFSVDNI